MKIIGKNPITGLDYPDPDVIRVDDTYYMVSTTMHFVPGCEILRSYDLVHWEHRGTETCRGEKLLWKRHVGCIAPIP